MKKFALIKKSVVLQVQPYRGKKGEWVECDKNTLPGMALVNGAFVSPPSPWHTFKLDESEWEITPENQALKYESEYVETTGEAYDKSMKNNKPFKALVMLINDGSLVTGGNISGQALKKLITDKIDTFS